MVKASLALRFILFISLLVLATSASLSLFFLLEYSNLQDAHIRRHGMSLARNLAHNAELGVLTRNGGLLRELGAGLFHDQDVISLSVVDAEGAPLLEERRSALHVKPLISLPGAYAEPVMGGEARVEPFTIEGSGRVEAYQMSYPVFTRRGTRRNEEIGLLLEEESRPGRGLEAIGQARVTLSMASTHRGIAELTWAFGLLTSVVIGFAIFLSVLLVRKMVAPLQALSEATRRIAGGHLDETVPETSHHEIGQLARSFNQMTSELKRSREELELHSANLENQVRARTRELQDTQNQLIQAEKISAVGLLVSGVAHELNNPLAGVVGFSQLLLRMEPEEKIQRGLEKINREAERCKRIVQNLQAFARKHKPEKEYVEINAILETTLELRAYQLKVDNIEVDKKLDPNLPRTMADSHQLQQVFLNMIVNAHQAMASQGKRGKLRLRSSSGEGRIVVEIEDNGPGIAPENIGRVFDPFFTTKEIGQGTGLGLSICYGIVQEHKGKISVRNGTGGGAIFAVELPISGLDTTGVGASTLEPRPVETGGPARYVLVVDDELSIIDILYQVLRMDGHRVDTALNGAVALRKIEKESYDVIISDLKMPGMDGKELYQKVREINLDLARRIIFSTGDVVSAETREFLEKSGNSYLQKPFEIDAIRRIVQSVQVNTGR